MVAHGFVFTSKSQNITFLLTDRYVLGHVTGLNGFYLSRFKTPFLNLPWDLLTTWGPSRACVKLFRPLFHVIYTNTRTWDYRWYQSLRIQKSTRIIRSLSLLLTLKICMSTSNNFQLLNFLGKGFPLSISESSLQDLRRSLAMSLTFDFLSLHIR